MEQVHEVVKSATTELRKLQEALKARSPDASENLSAAKSHLARINVWAFSIGLADPARFEATYYWSKVSSSTLEQVRSLLDDLVHLCREATTKASDSHNVGPEEAREGIDQALLEYFKPEEHRSTAESVSSEELLEILADIEDIIDCLFSLSPSIRNDIKPKPILNNSPTYTESSSQSERDMQLVRTIFPNLDSIIQDRLLTAISWRRNIIASWKIPPLKTQDVEKTHSEVHEVIESNHETRDRQGDSLRVQEKRSQPSRNERWLGTRGTLYDEEPRSSRVQAETTTDVESILGGSPAGAAPCPMCCVVVGRTSWNEHFSRDLRPYICLVKSCPDTQSAFFYHGDWVSHMVQTHWRSWNCPFCPSIERPSPGSLMVHVLLQHPNEVPSSQLGSFISLCGTSDSSRCRGKCQLCSVFDIKTSDQYQSHIEQHFEQLAASAFSDILDQGESGEIEALFKKSSVSHEQPDDVGLSSENQSSADAVSGTTHHSPKERRSSVSSISDQLKSISISRPTQESTQNLGAGMGSSGVDQAHQPQSKAITSTGTISPLEASATPGSSLGRGSASSTHVTESSTSPTSGKNTHLLRPQTSQDTSFATRTIRGYHGKPKPSVVYVWFCCYCGHAGMNANTTPACVSCGVSRCGNCYVESHKVHS